MSVPPFHYKPRRPRVDDYFGGCPICGTSTRTLNVGGNHWFVCDDDLTKWCVGYNLFSAWRDEDEATWRRNADELESFAHVKPLPPGPEDGGAP